MKFFNNFKKKIAADFNKINNFTNKFLGFYEIIKYKQLESGKFLFKTYL